MLKLKRIKINGFRRLVDIDLPLHPLCVMIGPNGVGKTSLLDVFSLLAASARGELQKKLSEFGGISVALTRDQAQQMSFTLSLFDEEEGTDDGPCNSYSLSIASLGYGYAISDEQLNTATFHVLRKSSDEFVVDVDADADFETKRPIKRPLESALSQLAGNDLGSWHAEQLGKSFFAGNLSVASNSPIKLPQSLQPTNLPGTQGENLISCLYSMRENDSPRFEVLLDTLSAAFPDFEGLEFPPVSAGMVGLRWKSRHFQSPLYPNQLSEGTLRFLWLSALLLSPELPTVTMIDEPEVSLHPELMALLVDLMRGASLHTQLLVATHSDRLVRFLKPEEVLVSEMTDEGHAKFAWASDLDLDEWLREYSLDELWAMNRLGELS